MEIKISIDKTIRFLYLALIVLFIGAMAVEMVGRLSGHWRLGGLTKLFILYGDNTAPTWFNSLLLIFVSLSSWSIALVSERQPRPLSGHWKFLAAIFLIMSMDEVAGIHETVGEVLGAFFETTGYFTFAFVLPGTILAISLFLSYLPFLRALPRKLALGMILSGGIYVTGAAGVEALSANWYYLHGDQASYRVIASIEELLEMTGLILLLKFLLDHLLTLMPSQDSGWTVRLKP